MSETATTGRATPARRRRFLPVRRTITAAALAAAVFVSGCVTQNRDAGFVVNRPESSERVRIGDTSKLRAGTFFEIYADAEERASGRSIDEELLWLAERGHADITEAKRAAARRVAERQAERSADELAWSLAAALEATFSQVLQIGFVRALDRKEETTPKGLADMSSTFHITPDRTATKPLGLALVVQRVEMQGAAEMFDRFPPPIDLSGPYALTTGGACAVAAGRYELMQHDRVFELVDDGRIVMYGAIGAARAFFVPNDQRYATITRHENGPPDIRYPDRNADIMQARLDRPELAIAMHNRPYGNCIIVLKAIGAES